MGNAFWLHADINRRRGGTGCAPAAVDAGG